MILFRLGCRRIDLRIILENILDFILLSVRSSLYKIDAFFIISFTIGALISLMVQVPIIYNYKQNLIYTILNFEDDYSFSI